jgi:hypothetical protein
MHNTNIREGNNKDYNAILKSAEELIDFLSECGRGLAMLRAYFDESGTHTGAPLVVVAGWLGDKKTWKSFIKEWSTYLRAVGVRSFHAKSPHCESLKEPLFQAILKRNLLGVACTVNPLDFQENVSDRFKNDLGNAYSTCAYLCAGVVSKLVRENSHDYVALIYEAGQPNANFICETITATITEPEDHRFSSVHFINKNHPGAIPLQTADFLSHAISTNETKWIERFINTGKLVPPVTMPPEGLRETSRKIERMISQERGLRRAARIYDQKK